MHHRKLAAAFAAALLALTLVPALPAFAADTGVITIQLTTPSGAPLRLAGVSLAVNGDGVEMAPETDANGQAVLGQFVAGISLGVMAQLPAGTKYLDLQHRAIPTNPGPNPVTVKLPIPVGASISGTVRSAAGSRIAGAEVRLLSTGGAMLGTTTTSASGVYSFKALPTGMYRVQFNARGTSSWTNPAVVNYGWQFWHGSSSWAGADSIALKQQTATGGAWAKTGINGTLAKAKSLVGTVKVAPASSTVVIEGVDVANRFSWVTTPGATPSAAQTFSTRLGKGYYRVGVIGYDGTTVFWWTGSSTIASPAHAAAKKFYFSGVSNVALTIELPQP